MGPADYTKGVFGVFEQQPERMLFPGCTDSITHMAIQCMTLKACILWQLLHFMLKRLRKMIELAGKLLGYSIYHGLQA